MVTADNQSNQQHGFNSIMLYLDRGLQSPALADVLAVVRSCPCYVEDMPFPVLVNAVLLRLAETFQGEKFNPKLEQFLNLVRLNIIKAVREFRHHVHVAFSSDEIVRCIMKVSHSNDFHARSLTLLFLAALAPLVAENAKAHHLIIESLDCSEEMELSAAILASTELGRQSVAFCALMVGKIAHVLSSAQTALEVKLRLLAVMANFHDNANIARTCLQLSEQLLRSNFNRQLHAATLDASTKLAARSGLANEQIELLLSELDKTVNREKVSLILCIMRNLARLADFPRYWSTDKVKVLRNMFNRLTSINSSKIIGLWFACMESLTSTDLHCSLLLDRDLPWIRILKNENMQLRVAGMRLLLNIMRNGVDEEYLCSDFVTTSAETISDIRQLTYADKMLMEMEQFYKSISVFARMPQCTSANALIIVYNLTRDDLLIQFCDENKGRSLNLVTETLCSICDAHPDECGPVAAKWAFRQFMRLLKADRTEDEQKMEEDAKRPLFNCSQSAAGTVDWIPFSLYNLILMPPTSAHEMTSLQKLANISSCGTELECIEHDELIIEDNDLDINVEGINALRKNDSPGLVGHNTLNNFLQEFDRALVSSREIKKSSAWTRYKLARSAFHYGHWRAVALPMLQSLQRSCDSMETSSWISALISMAQVHWTDDEHLSVNELVVAEKHLHNSQRIFQRLAATPRRSEHSFAFASAYVNCLALTWQAVRLVLSVINVKLPMLKCDVSCNSGFSIPESCLEQVSESLLAAKYKLVDSRDRWTVLLQQSFDADAHTLEHIYLWTQLLLLWENALLFLCGELIATSIPVDDKKRYFGSNTRRYLGCNDRQESIRCNAINNRFNKLIKSLKHQLDEVIGGHDTLPLTSTAAEIKPEDPDDAKLLCKELRRSRLTHKNLKTMRDLLNTLKMIPMSLPRYFFQRIFHTQIKLNVSPTPRENDGMVGIHVSLLPLTVEGVIQSDNAKQINGVTVIAEFFSSTDNGKFFSEKREICLDNGENYFKTQFLLKITEQTTKVSVRLTFTDVATQRSWIDESTGTELTISYQESAKQATSSVSAASAN